MPLTLDHDDTIAQVAYDAATCPCDACVAKRDRYGVKRKDIKHHGFKPSGGFEFRRAGVNDTARYYLGVELETDSHIAEGHVVSPIGATAVAAMARPEGFWEPTTDGSISGIEFVSHPATMTWWRSQETELREMLRALIHAGYRSHDNGSCGMHVSISRSAFDDEDHFYRFMTLVHFDAEFSVAVSQRKGADQNNWCKIAPNKKVSSRRETAKQMYRNRFYADRYVAMNAPEGESRYEFRMPRGTLRFSRFMKNLEWLVSMVEFTRTAKLRDCKATKYIEFVKVNKKEYPNLVQFLWEKEIDTAADIRDARRIAAERERQIKALRVGYDAERARIREISETERRAAIVEYDVARAAYNIVEDRYYAETNRIDEARYEAQAEAERVYNEMIAALG